MRLSDDGIVKRLIDGTIRIDPIDCSVATFDGSRESVLAPRGNAQPEYPLRGFPRL